MDDALSDVVVRKTTTYIGGLVYQNDTLQFIPHEEGRIRFKPANGSVPASFQYDYMLKDHLGNVRMVLTEEQKTDVYPAATMETGSSSTEEALYFNLPATRVDKPSGYPYDPYLDPNYKVAKVRGDGNKIGPAMVLKVMAGDKFNLRVSSWWNSGATPGTPVSPLNDLITALSNGVASVSGGKATATELTSTGISSTAATGFLNSQTYNNARPKAFVNWIFLDEQFKYYSGGFEQVGVSGSFAPHIRTDVPINKSVYLYVYVSNETSNIDVFFDNLQVTHIRGPLLEETHYYPFGLTMSGISSKALNFGQTENKKKYQQYEFNSDFDINLYESFYRSHDPQLGRFWQIDPKPNFLESPYAAMVNNPIMNMDPLGDTLLNKADHRIANRIEKQINSTNTGLNKQASKLTTQIAEAKGDKAKADNLRAKLGDVNSRMSANTTSLSRLNAIRNDQKWGYTFNQLPASSTEGGTKLGVVKNSSGEQQVAVVMSILSNANAVHEMTHAYQGMIEQSILINGSGAAFFGKTLFDRQMSNAVSEIGAYQAQYGFDSGTLPSSTIGGQPQAMNQINAFYVAGINDNSTPPKPIYPDVRNMVNAIINLILRF